MTVGTPLHGRRKRRGRALPTRVPFVDLVRIHGRIRSDLLSEVGALLDSGAFSNGPAVPEFERVFADFCGTTEAVGAGSGLDALRLGLLALDLGPGDEVVVPADAFVSTVEAVWLTGADPVLVDVSAQDYNIDNDAAEAAITTRTRALLPVHLYGQLADMRRLTALAERYDLRVLEDASHAHGAVRDGVQPGTTSDASVFSFYPSANLGGVGDGGALVTMRRDLAATVRSLHEREGFTARLDTLQAAVLLRKLPLLVRWTADRRRAAAAYSAALDGVGDLVLPHVPPGSEPVWHLYVVQTAQPAALAAFLHMRGIGTGRHFSLPPHLSPAYRNLGYRPGNFPVTERLAAHCLSLPMFAGITDGEIDRVVEQVSAYFAHA